MAARPEIQSQSLLNINRATAVARLGTYLRTPAERALHAEPGREHQGDVMDDTLAFFASGKTAGYIDLPTGTGKTVIAASLIRALKMNTIVVSPTGTILDQTKATIEDIDPDAHVSNFDGRSKNLAGNVINTTINSLSTIAEIGPLAEGTELIILDEIHHGTLGEQRHKLWRKFPNALIVGLTATPDPSKLEGLQDRGLVDSDERWTGAFTELISSMSREEAMQRGALTHLDIHMVKTNTVVGNVHVTSGGKYDRGDVERYLNRETRNLLVIAAIAGLDKLPPGVELPEDMRQDLQEIHNKIKGKRTVVFGLNISHIEKLAQRLRALDITAAAVHGRMPVKDRKTILANHKKGADQQDRVQVVLADDLLKLGWDSPSTEVGLFMNMTQSGIELAQELGRILRLSKDTGKTRAVAVQLIDDHPSRLQRPVLLSDLFDPEYVVRGARRSSASAEGKRAASTAKSEESIITIHGLHIEGIIEQARSDALLTRKFEGASVEDMNRVFGEIIAGLNHDYDDTSALAVYRAIADVVPKKLFQDLQKVALEAVKSAVPKKKREGERALLLLNMRGILSILEPHFTGSEAQNEDIVQSALQIVYQNIDQIDPDKNVPFQLRNMLRRAEFVNGLAQDEGVANNWVRDRKSGKIMTKIDEALAADLTEPLDDSDATLVAGVLSAKTGYDERVLFQLVQDRQERAIGVVDLPEEGDFTGDTVMEVVQYEAIAKVLATLSEREAGVIRMRYGLDDGEPTTLDETGAAYGLTRERIRQIESKTLSKLRHPQRAETLRGFLEE